jgi:hypothetical protein
MLRSLNAGSQDPVVSGSLERTRLRQGTPEQVRSTVIADAGRTPAVLIKHEHQLKTWWKQPLTRTSPLIERVRRGSSSVDPKIALREPLASRTI